MNRNMLSKSSSSEKDLSAEKRTSRTLDQDFDRLLLISKNGQLKRSSGRDSAAGSKFKHLKTNKEIPDVKEMEKSLGELLVSFKSGKLKAFDTNCGLEQMKNIREQQEQLSKRHFEFGMSNDFVENPLDDEYLEKSQQKMHHLIEKLDKLSVSIEGLHSAADK